MISSSITPSSSDTVFLSFSAQPSSGTGSSVCSSGVTVTSLKRSSSGLSTITTYSQTIALTLIADDGAGSLSSVGTCTWSSGSCTISTCTVTGYGTFMFLVSGSSATSAYSSSFTVTSGTPSTIVLSSVSTTVYRGTEFTVTATVKDSSSVLVNQDLTFYLSVSSGTGEVVSGSSAVVSSGILTFEDVIIDGSGSHTLTVTCPGCSSTPTVTTTTVAVNTRGLLSIYFPNAAVESASSQYYEVSLTKAPTSSVTVSFSSSDSSVLSLDTTSLTFSTSNYATSQKVYFSVYEIADSTNPYSSAGVTHIVSSDDDVYNGKADLKSCMGSVSTITIPIYGYQEYSITVQTAINVAELDQATLSITLGAAPTSDVTISITCSSTVISVSTSKMIFTSSSWDTQYFTVNGPDSGTTSTYTTYTISYSISTSDSNFASGSVIKRPSSLQTTVVVTPATSYSLVFDSSAVMLMSMHYGSYLVRLSADPSYTVTVTISSASSNVVVSPTTLYFYPNYGKVYQEVSLYAANGSPSSSPSYAVSVSHSTSSSDSRFNSLSKTFSVTVTDKCLNLPYSWPTGNKCTCPAGFDCQGNEPVPCPAGTYSGSSDVKCTMCPAGSSCSNPASSPAACSSGYYSYEFFTTCFICPAGYACSSTNGHRMKKCTQGSYSAPGATTCSTPSTSGHVAPSPEYAYTTACPTGYYAPHSSDACVPCPAGYSCSLTTATVCSAGYYALAGMGSCKTCPDHHECDPALGPTRICPEGTYRASSTTLCALCTSGYYCTAAESSRPVACASGYTSSAGASYCTSSSGTYGDYPGFDLSGTTLSQCSATTYACYVGSYTSYTSYIRCIQDYGRCYPVAGGETAAGTLASSGKYGLIASGTLALGFVGFKLPAHADRPDMAGFECPPGYYCTDSNSITACAAGKFYPSVRAYASSSCMDCPPGYACPLGTGDYELYPCPGGGFCNSGSSAKTNCLAGTYRNSPRGIEEGSCDQCPDGYYCAAGTTNPSVCSRGYICPIGSSTEIPCPLGTYNLFTGKYKIEDCVVCPPGSSCSSAATTFIWCKPGFYNPYHGSSSCFLCPPGYACIGYNTVKPYVKCKIGYYCPAGSKTPIEFACPPGTYGVQYGAYSINQCEKCPPGYYCGYATQYITNPPVECPAGYYCPIGTKFKWQYPCLAGTYNDKTRREGIHECLDCPAGYYCLNATTSATANACIAGFYCPRGTSKKYANMCPAGTFRSATGGTSETDCTQCSQGKYCLMGATSETSCPTGTYMDEYGASEKGPGSYPACKPCPAGYYSSSTGSTSCTQAAVGYYTYEGATSQTACVVGYFCAEAGTSEYTMYMSPCPAGYLCSAGTSTYPSKSSNGCAVGYYCPEKTSAAIACPIGTYRNTKAARSIYDCQTVPAGYYVASTGTSDYSSYPCNAGYYCPEGSTSATEKACPKGTYRDLTGGKAAIDCAACPPGKYCDTTATVTPTTCPATKYCPAGTITPLQCPSGTYSSTTGLKSSSECTSCDAGQYCESPGQSATTGDCTAGYICISGSSLAAPEDGVTGDLCPAGGYCEAGTASAASCPSGFFNNFEGGMSSSDCVSCWPGYYCAGDTNPTPTAKCNAGYYCNSESSSATENAAQSGYYAPSGSVYEIPCLQGTYNPSTAQESCTSCPAGNYCGSTALESATTCSAGYYCKTGSFVQSPCPIGTFRSGTGGQSSDDCTACSAGNYCQFYGQSAVEDTCSAGYYCTSSAQTSTPWIESAGEYGRCPEGYYCESGSTEGTKCPAGTFNPSEGAEDESGCVSCPAGYACANLGTTSYSKKCRAGFFCAEKSTDYQPSDAKCSVGNYCPEGSAVELKCPAGKYQDKENQSTCKTCPPGYYCPIETSDYYDNDCPVGYYCPSGTTYSTQYPCPVGTYSPYTGQQSSDTCQDCTVGKYCNVQGASEPTGLCSEGFYCSGASTSPRPTDTSMGGRCTAGYYCPEGSSSKIECDAGSYCPDDEMSEVRGSCQAGYYCISASTTPTPTDGTTGDKCLEHFYCEEGTSSPVQCSAGKYIPYTGASSESECLDCMPGYYCDGTDPKVCGEGYYCSGGDAIETDECERGYYCPEGSAEQIKCAAGTYQPETGQGSCSNCAAGYYCLEGAYQMVSCPKGYYCPLNTAYGEQYPCDVGKYNNLLGQTSSSACKSCDKGKYCATLGADSITGSCAEGYYCISGAKVSKPTDGTTGNICPIGYYCPEGSSTYTACDAGYYCNQKGLAEPSGECYDGYYCISKATSPTPTDGTTGDICSVGHYCPSGSSSEEDCPTGTYGPTEGMSDLSQCIDCPYGKYCASVALEEPSGDCDQGYYCLTGKDSATPTDGLCPKYYYCDNSINYVKAPCPKGLYSDVTGLDACKICTEGYYCTGGTGLPTKCPKGYKCPQDSVNSIGTRIETEFPCEEGYYSSSLASADCTICPAGRMCNNAATTSELLCPVSKYCPEGTGYGYLCEAGTYNSDYQGLQSADECTACPAGQFCVDGSISGQCAAGFWCKGGSSTPTPTTESDTGEPCPPGYYCEKGTTTPQICTEGKFRKDPGARAETDCSSCPPGSYCVSGETNPYPCTTGHYCPVATQVPIECPKRTYNDKTSAETINDCKICPAGYLCKDVGISYYTDYPCKPGYFCVEGATGYINCPPGTYTFGDNAGSIDDCIDCPGGFYCPSNSTKILSCPEGTYCPGGNSLYWPCPPGYLCYEETIDPLPCPSGQYCPLYGSSSQNPPFECDSGSLCPGAYFDQATCSAGSYYNKIKGVCEKCARGFYSDGQKSQNCVQCQAGYICTGGANRKNPTTTENGGYACPVGYYCPQGKLYPIACPVATYNLKTARTSESDCLLCPNNTYGEETGQSKCKSCGPHAVSGPGSLTCTCTAKFRNYQKFDGSCVCIPTYEYYINEISSGDEDSDKDCTPVSFVRCTDTQVRAADGSCQSSTTNCKSECQGGASGSLKEKYGKCSCNGLVGIELDTIKKYPVVTMNSKLQYLVYDPDSKQTVTLTVSGSTYLASVSCSSTCNVHSVSFTSDGPQGTYGVPKNLEKSYYSKVSRRLAVNSDPVLSPLLCIKTSDTVVFSLNPKQNFPVYLKNSLLNTNKNFDYAAFKELANRMRSQNSNVDTFAFTFKTEGIYDIADNSNNKKTIVIKVVSDISKCVAKSRDRVLADVYVSFYPSTEDNMASFGLETTTGYIEEPNWGTIAGILVAVFIALLVFIAFLAFLHWRALASNHARKRLLKLVKDCCKRCRIRNVALVSPIIQIEDESDSIDVDKDLLEPSQFRELLDKLNTYYNELQATFDSQDEDARRTLEDLLGQAKDLKILLGDRLGDLDPAELRSKIKEGNLESSEDESNIEIPEIMPVVLNENLNLAMNAVKEADADNKVKMQQEMFNSIMTNPNLTDSEKADLMKEFETNLQRMEQVLDNDLDQAQKDINRRLQERAARRNAAAREKAYINPKREEIHSRVIKEQERVEREVNTESKAIEDEYIEEMERIKKENRKEIDLRLKDMRTRLQNDLMHAGSQMQIDNLMKVFEVESKRMEEQIMGSKRQQEAEMLKKIEDRRKARLEKLLKKAEEKKEDIENRTQEELHGLEQRALLAFAKVNVEVQLDPEEENLISQVANNYERQKEDLKLIQEQELIRIDQELQVEEEKRGKEKERLAGLIQNSTNTEEKEMLMKALEDFESAEISNKMKQEDRLKAQLLERKRKRAEREALLKAKHDSEANQLDLRKNQAEKELRSEFELRKLEQMLENSENHTPEELIAMAREILEAKHDRETANLTTQKHSKLRERQNDAVRRAVEKKTQEKAAQRDLYNSQLASIKNSKLDPATRKSRLDEVEYRLLEAEKQIDDGFILGMHQEQDRIWRETEEDFKQQFNDMSEAQNQEIYKIMNKIKGVDSRMLDANISDMQQEIDKQRAELGRKHAEKLRELDRRAEELREIEKQRLLEIDFINSQLKDTEEKQRKLDEVQQQRMVMEERQRKVIESMKERGISQEKMNEMLEQHQREMNEWEKAMENERVRQQQKLQARLDAKRQKYNERKAQIVAKFKEENEKMVEKQAEVEQNKLKIVFDTGRDVKLYTPKVEIETKLRFPDLEQEQEIASIVAPNILDEVINKVRRVEKVAENIDTKQFNLLLKAFSDVSDMMEAVKSRFK